MQSAWRYSRSETYVKTTKMERGPHMSVECSNSPTTCVYLNSSISPSTPVGRYLSSIVQKRKLRFQEAPGFIQSHSRKDRSEGHSHSALPTSVASHDDSSSLLDGVSLRCFCFLFTLVERHRKETWRSPKLCVRVWWKTFRGHTATTLYLFQFCA